MQKISNEKKIFGTLALVSSVLKSAYFHAEIDKKVFKNGYPGCKKITYYISVTVQDRPIVTIIHRWELIYLFVSHHDL